MSDELRPEYRFDYRQAKPNLFAPSPTSQRRPLAEVEVFIPLLNEGTVVLRPTKGLVLGPDIIQVLATTDYDPAVEQWQFPPGSKVRCISEVRDGRRVLVARNPAEFS